MPEGSPSLARPRPSPWRLGLAIVISVALLAWAIRGVHLDQFLEQVRRARLIPMAGAVALATSTFVLRLFRWRLLLRNPDGTAIRFRPLWHAIAIGFTANNLLPLRAGELVRTYAVSRLAPTRMTSALSSIAVERVFDSLAVVLLLTIALFTPGMPEDTSIGGWSIAQLTVFAGIASALALLAAGAVVAFPAAAERVVRRLLPDRWAAKLVHIIEGVRQGLMALGHPGRLIGVLLWSVVIWLVNGLAFYVGFAIFDIPVNLAGALLLQGVLVFGIAVPAAPGFVGVFEAVIRAVLELYGIAADRALSFAITYHVTTFIPITLLGIYSLLATGIRLSQVRGEKADG